ncbi:NT5C3A, partial [Symbiodinium microadriaticum]
KKAAFAAAGPRSLNVFTDFERVLTKSHVAGSNGERTLSSAEVLEASAAIAPEAMRQLADLGRDLEASEMDYEDFERFTSKCRDVIVREGHLHISSIAPLVKEYLPRMGLRPGHKETLSALTSAGVPTYVFSSGYGDIVRQ